MSPHCSIAITTAAFAILLSSCHSSPPAMAIDKPGNGAIIKGATQISGWAANAEGVASVTIYVDAKKVAQASTGIQRRDVIEVYRRFEDWMVTGWNASIDASSLSRGAHYLIVRAKAGDHGIDDQVLITVIVAR